MFGVRVRKHVVSFLRLPSLKQVEIMLQMATKTDTYAAQAICRVVVGEADIRPTDVVLDSTDISPECPCFRVDHHVDNGWTNLDSVARVDTSRLAAVYEGAFVTNYLDPDAIISAGVLAAAISHGIDTANFLNTALGKVLYSASFWCDYGVPFPKFSDETNALGSQLELWLRYRHAAALGREDRAASRSERAAAGTPIFADLATRIAGMVRQESIPPEVGAFDSARYLEEIRNAVAKFVCPALGTSLFGVISISDPKLRVVTRAYFPYFVQPIIVRVIEGTKGNQILIGPNPLKAGWESLNLEKLGRMVLKQNPAWKLTGRRFVIGTNEPAKQPLSDLLPVLGSVQISQIQDSCPLWTVYE